MDNISHTLAGLLLGECALELRASRAAAVSSRLRGFVLLGSALANNLPDLDFVYARITARPLGYLLHHRGHTHTVPVALALGCLTFAAILPFARRGPLAQGEMVRLAAVCLAGPFAHIALDFCNNYGVHPFWPLYDGWMYGDAIFIVEPFFWVVAVPVLALASRTLVWRFALGLLLLLTLSAAWLLPVVARASAAALTLTSLLMFVATARARPAARVVLSVAASLTIAAIFFVASSRAKALARHSSAAAGVVIHDIVVTPLPANPFCFGAWIVATNEGTYRAHRAVVAPLPGIVPARLCPADAREHPTAPLLPDSLVSTDEVLWRGVFAAPALELAGLALENCHAAAFLRFARVPYWVKTNDGYIVGDLRYDRNPGLDFADVMVKTGEDRGACPAAVPPWTPPRLDVLAAQLFGAPWAIQLRINAVVPGQIDPGVAGGMPLP